MNKSIYEHIVESGSFQYRLPNGAIGWMHEEVTYRDPARYVGEVMALQMALGVHPDGIIGPLTRAAAKTLAKCPRACLAPIFRRRLQRIERLCDELYRASTYQGSEMTFKRALQEIRQIAVAPVTDSEANEA